MTAPSWSDDMQMLLVNDAEKKPRSLIDTVNVLGQHYQLTESEFAAFVESRPLNNPLIHHLHRALLKWDAQESAPWSADDDELEPAKHTPERRAAAYRALGFAPALADVLDGKCPVVQERKVVISREFEHWYDQDRVSGNNFYWAHYEKYLVRKGWGTDIITALDLASTDVVRRLSDPTRTTAKRTRGLVIGYVQSGKTANFTGVAAKAIDAGYRLVIVLTGTVEMLRAQTQRRLDKELVGRENLTHGLDLESELWFKEFDYAGDAEWDAKGVGDAFVSHGDVGVVDGTPRIIRTTTLRADYKRLKQELTKLRFSGRPKKSAPLNDPENLAAIDAYLAVVKKNATTLKKLITDLRAVGRKTLDELPILIIDDESDQASIDTTSPRARGALEEERKRRTAINRAISEILALAPRAQYVGYTATPFANVFVDPTDDQDIFPSDFLVTLPRPDGYMGVFDFHDLERDWTVETESVATSNRLAHVRSIEDDLDVADLDGEVRDALDAFVLSGAIKLYRKARGSQVGRHHTMLVHESVRKSEHADTAQRVRSVWKSHPANAPGGLRRLERLWDEDYRPVALARSKGFPVPATFAEIRPYIGQAFAKITVEGDPVIVVNSDTELQRNAKRLDFDAEDIWRILVGGTKLSRGFTVEGLTVSYFRRKPGQGDTLMQAGRWFGYRKGYQDLVRLYIPDGSYAAFEAVLRDEEAFRDELARYEGFDEDGKPLLTPQAVPPLIRQHLPSVKLTAANKMWNAEITELGVSGTIRDMYNVPLAEQSELKIRNMELVCPLLDRCLTKESLGYELDSKKGSFEARTGLVSSDELLAVLNGFKWHPAMVEQVRPYLSFFQRLCREHKVEDWAVIWPQLGQAGTVTVEGLDGKAPLVIRSRRPEPRHDFSGSDSKHRKPAEDIVAKPGERDGYAPAHLIGTGDKRGSVLVYLVWDPQDEALRDELAPDKVGPGDITVLLSFAVPERATPDHGRVLVWRRRQDDALHRDLIAIDAPPAGSTASLG